MDQLKVGADTQAYCTSCKTMHEHVIVAMVGTRPAKVECAECHKQHLFRAGPPGTKAPKAAKTGAAKPRKKAGSDAVRPPPLDINALIAGRDPRGYDPKVGFGLGDVVRHPSFGVGIVVALPGAQKMEIAFEVGTKLLAHDRGAAIASTLTRPAKRDDDEKRTVTDAPPDRPR